MQDWTQTPSGRSHTHASAPADPAARWQVLNHLRRIAPAFGLKPRELATLQALMSFIAPGEGRFIVYASNETLRLRLMNISARTIQRHVLRLEEAGLLRRRLSANRKRFSIDESNSYGFDLAPLYERSDEITALAEAAAETERQQRILRHRILARLRDALSRSGSDALARMTELSDQTRLALRRARTLADLQEIHSNLPEFPHPAEPALGDKVTDPVRQNDGAIQDTIRSPDFVEAGNRADPDAGAAPGPDSAGADTPPLHLALEACPAVSEIFGTVPDCWYQAASTARTLAGYLGIPEPVSRRAAHQLGPRRFAVSTFLILQRFSGIRNPSAYLVGMVKKAESGLLNLTRQCQYLRHSAAHP